MLRALLAIFGAAALATLVIPASAQAQQAETFRADLAPLNGSGSTGTATVQVQDRTVTVTVNSSDVSPTLPHAQHIHIGGQNICPPPTAAGQDSLISTAEGQPFYGAVQVSLTTEGAVGADSALAVERFPVASDDGTISYSRTFDLPDGVTVDDVRQGVIVQHGISKLFADEAQYDGEPRSSLDPSLPLEATIPTNCGRLVAAGGAATPGAPAAQQAPQGGVAAGAGGTAGSGTAGPFLLATAVALVGVVAAGLLTARGLVRAE